MTKMEKERVIVLAMLWRVRVNWALRLMRNQKKYDFDTLKEVMSDHVNFPNSI
jgi:hypothetical protein